MFKEYKTIKNVSIEELIEKKSRFIATAKNVNSQEEANNFINEIKSKYWDAKHNVYAYVILNDNFKKYSDDGEPSGTAGLPILNVLEKEELYNVIVVVTRYFGGTLLGTGGLVRAYSQAAKNCLLKSGIVSRCLCNNIKISCDYSLLGKIQNILQVYNIPITEINYSAAVEVNVIEKVDKTLDFISVIIDKTDAMANCVIGQSTYVDIDNEGKLVK